MHQSCSRVCRLKAERSGRDFVESAGFCLAVVVLASKSCCREPESLDRCDSPNNNVSKESVSSARQYRQCLPLPWFSYPLLWGSSWSRRRVSPPVNCAMGYSAMTVHH
ncbi:hypothetical protein BJX68DRAFT_250024 [Aspergillus pseudodeflectus]|uniref:Secreted protein n=1 Tax=Aspergillus pseudodeflectus TaxID=176178 RepID=A0ABR4JAK0_9EURO